MSNIQAQIWTCLASVPSSELCSQEGKGQFYGIWSDGWNFKSSQASYNIPVSQIPKDLAEELCMWEAVSPRGLVDHINSKELCWEIKNVSAECNMPSVKPGLILTDTNHSSQKQVLTEKLLMWFAFTLAGALAAQILIRQFSVGSCLLPNTLIWIDCRTSEVLDAGSLSLNLAEEEQLVAQLIWVPRSNANHFIAQRIFSVGAVDL